MKLPSLLSPLVFTTFTLATTNSTTAAPVVDLGYVQFQGAPHPLYPSVLAYYGLRYAAPAANDLRWRAPINIERSGYYSNSTEAVDATTPGPSCMEGLPAWQKPIAYPYLTAGSEDCLLLNVLVPKGVREGEKVPVVVQIHGGGYVQGNSTTGDGGYLVDVSNGSVISVEIQYRLGGLGFLASEEVKGDGTANAGILDQRSALHWVQRHISAFGGDTEKVTVVGASAGGGSVAAQLMLYGGEVNPPFRAAIAEYPWLQPFHQKPVLERQYTDLLSASSCGNLTCLRQLPYSLLFSAINQTYHTGYAAQSYGFGDFYFGPVVDGTIIRNLPSIEFAAGRFSKVPLMVNHDALEGFVFLNSSLTTEDEVRDSLEQVWPAATSFFFSGLQQLWPVASFSSSPYLSYIRSLTANNTYFASVLSGRFATQLNSTSSFFRGQDIVGQVFISCPTYLLASTFSKHNLPVWKMIYNSGMLVHAAVDQGVYSEPSELANATQSRLVQEYVLGFVKGLDPGPSWPRYGKDAKILEVNLTSAGVNEDPDRGERCEFLLGNGEILRNRKGNEMDGSQN